MAGGASVGAGWWQWTGLTAVVAAAVAGDQVTKYVGGESPSLNRLGGSDWAKTKGRARKADKEESE